ncbi:hypothetical protein GGE07_005738 [Sinorhizobium terangae]|nr:hypothetical protein [Sinorhizobium terangae]
MALTRTTSKRSAAFAQLRCDTELLLSAGGALQRHAPARPMPLLLPDPYGNRCQLPRIGPGTPRNLPVERYLVQRPSAPISIAGQRNASGRSFVGTAPLIELGSVSGAVGNGQSAFRKMAVGKILIAQVRYRTKQIAGAEYHCAPNPPLMPGRMLVPTKMAISAASQLRATRPCSSTPALGSSFEDRV